MPVKININIMPEKFFLGEQQYGPATRAEVWKYSQKAGTPFALHACTRAHRDSCTGTCTRTHIILLMHKQVHLNSEHKSELLTL